MEAHQASHFQHTNPDDSEYTFQIAVAFGEWPSKENKHWNSG
jgi:hypothetical protein